MMRFSVKTHGVTDVGLQRSHNEDAFDSIDDQQFYVVADGMGGHASGQVASRIAVDSLRKYILKMVTQPTHEFAFPVRKGAGPPEVLMSNAIQFANERVFIESMKDLSLEGMGTTVVCVLGFHNVMVMGHVGDSRVYRLRQGTIEAVTRDHSLLNHYIDEGKITTQQEIQDFVETNVILKALGLKDYVEPEITIVDRKEGDLFLLCTDGLTDQVEDWVIQGVLEGNRDNLTEACRALVQLANDAGGKDNCTVLILDVNELAPDPQVEATDTTQKAMPDDEQYHDDEDGFGERDEDEVTDPNLDASPLASLDSPSIQIDPDYAAEAEAQLGRRRSEKDDSSSRKKRKKRSTLIDTYPQSRDSKD